MKEYLKRSMWFTLDKKVFASSILIQLFRELIGMFVFMLKKVYIFNSYCSFYELSVLSVKVFFS